MKDYSKSVIYQLECKNPEIKEVYVGSSTNYKKRFREHKNTTKDYYVYRFIRDNGGWDNWDMKVLEHYDCNNKTELLKRERYYYHKQNSKLNTCVPSRGEYEYRLLVKPYRKTIIHCNICDTNFTRINQSRHLRSEKHKKFVSNPFNGFFI